MNMRDFRKFLFINSQYCTYYIDRNQTVAAGIMRSDGYKYNERLSDEKISKLEQLYRKYTTILNLFVSMEILLYIYCVVFPYYVKLVTLPYFLFIMLLSIIPLVGLYLTYIVINLIFEQKLQEFGSYQKVKFSPNIYNVEPKAFDRYIETPRKSIYVLGIIICAFLYFVLTPIIIDNLNNIEKYKLAVKTSNLYLKLIPINSDTYAERAYAEYKTGKFEEALKDFEKANIYGNTNSYDFNILGVKLKMLNFDDAIAEFDKEINASDSEDYMYFLLCEKAIYLQQHAKYKEALTIYDSLIKAYENKRDSGFAADFVYYQRSQVKKILGDKEGAAFDQKIAKKICSECEFKLESELVQQP